MQHHHQNKIDKINRAGCEWALQHDPNHNHLLSWHWLITCRCFYLFDSFHFLPDSCRIAILVACREIIHLNSLTAFKQTQKAMRLLSSERGLVNDSCLACLIPPLKILTDISLFYLFIYFNCKLLTFVCRRFCNFEWQWNVKCHLIPSVWPSYIFLFAF